MTSLANIIALAIQQFEEEGKQLHQFDIRDDAKEGVVSLSYIKPKDADNSAKSADVQEVSITMGGGQRTKGKNITLADLITAADMINAKISVDVITKGIDEIPGTNKTDGQQREEATTKASNDTTEPERQETCLFGNRAKLFILEDDLWTARGVGILQILRTEDTNELRIVMLSDDSTKDKVLLDHNMLMVTDVEQGQCTRTVRWQTKPNDASTIQVCCRFRAAEIANLFKSAMLNLAGLEDAGPQDNGVFSFKKNETFSIGDAETPRKTTEACGEGINFNEWDCIECYVHNTTTSEKCNACGNVKPANQLETSQECVGVAPTFGSQLISTEGSQHTTRPVGDLFGNSTSTGTPWPHSTVTTFGISTPSLANNAPRRSIKKSVRKLRK